METQNLIRNKFKKGNWDRYIEKDSKGIFFKTIYFLKNKKIVAIYNLTPFEYKEWRYNLKKLFKTK